MERLLKKAGEDILPGVSMIILDLTAIIGGMSLTRVLQVHPSMLQLLCTGVK